MYRSAAGPIDGIRALVTRPAEQAAPLAEALADAGATPVLYPTIRIVPTDDWGIIDRLKAPQETGRTEWAADPRARTGFHYDWVVFTSATAARLVCSRVRLDPLTSIAAVGPATAEVVSQLWRAPDLVATDQRQQGLLADLLKRLRFGAEVLFPQAADGRRHLADELRLQGIQIDVVPVYQTLPVDDMPPAPLLDAATFMSPSALSAFAGDPARLATLEKAVVAVVGPTTAERAHELGVRVDVAAARPGARALVEALVSFYQGRRVSSP